MESNYTWAMPYVNRLEVRIICEVGSRDGLDAIYLSDLLDSQVYCFECDPINFEITKQNLVKSSSKIELFNYALGNECGQVSFYSIDPLRYLNRGASSLFRIDFSDRPVTDPDFGKIDIQNECVVEMRRFDSLGLVTPDLVVMDVEGSELMVLEGFAEHLHGVKYIVTECTVSPGTSGRASFSSIREHLKTFGFMCGGIEGSQLLNFMLSVFNYHQFIFRLLKVDSEINTIFTREMKQ
jgi:FkbM family methyltransferase